MDLKQYKQFAQKCKDDELVSQYYSVRELAEKYWGNVQDCSDDEISEWLDKYHEASERQKILECELSYRNINI